MDRITDLDFEDQGIKMVLYGSSGSGKTTLWATFPKPILAIICSGGFKSGELRSVRSSL
jgi:ABC-type polar amino acid transport system ATPase subunit